MRSLYWKVGSALLLIVLVSVGLTAYLANINTGKQFQAYVQQGASGFTRNVSSQLAQFYSQNKDWAGVQNYLQGLLPSSTDRLLVANSADVIIADTSNLWLNMNTNQTSLTNGTPIMISGKLVGTVFMVAQGPGGGRGFMGGRGAGMMATTTPEQHFLTGINNSLIVVGLITAAVAILIGLFLTRQILKPVHALTKGASRLASGDLKYRVDVKAKDEIGKLAQSFNAMATSLERSEESRRQLNADITHELRTPLTIIEGTADGIIDGVFEHTPQRINAIKEQTGLLTKLINDLRDISLAESGQLKLELKPVDMADLVHHKVKQIESVALERGFRLDFFAPDLLPNIFVDASRMEQVISNLLMNALRHTPSGGSITISVVNKEQGVVPRTTGRQLLISVADTGEGISIDNLPHIFERFYRVDNARSRSAGGTGLGLAIVKQMVEAHGGIVWAESDFGKGSTFYIALPIKEN